MIVTGTYHPHTLDGPTAPTSAPVGGDPSKPGAWTQDQIDEWNHVKACAAGGHAPFWNADPRPYEDTCGGCGAIVRTVNTSESWVDHWAEERLDNRAYDLAVATDTEVLR